mgnify:CR=1 FL=1
MYYIYVLGIVDGNNEEVQSRINAFVQKIKDYETKDYVSINKFLYENNTWILENGNTEL